MSNKQLQKVMLNTTPEGRALFGDLLAKFKHDESYSYDTSNDLMLDLISAMVSHIITEGGFVETRNADNIGLVRLCITPAAVPAD